MCGMSRDQTLRVRLTPEEMAAVDNYAQENGMDRSQAAREKLLSDMTVKGKYHLP